VVWGIGLEEYGKHCIALQKLGGYGIDFCSP
jgi:hypothetical protein